jgi:hypothetical protein
VTKLISILLLVGALAVAGCGGGGSDDASEPLQTGVYEYELTEQYLLDNGISTGQAANESGQQEVTLEEDGTFLVRWETAAGTTGSCRGTYEEDDDQHVSFHFTSGCFGDWEMTYAVEGDTVTWGDQEALPPYDSDEDQKVSEVFNSVPWTRVGDASGS